MGPKKPVALRGGGGGEDIDKTSAKHLLDSIGKRVHAQVQNEAAGRGGSELKGLLSLATFSSEEMGDTNDPCIFNYTKVIKATDNNETCGKGKEDRFSKNRIAEYDKKKIRGNNGGDSAPYRKLSLCNKNLETINIDKIDNKQKLLADVCFAAKHEGESISDYYPQYQTTYGNFPFELCTVLARRFADIGDIIRGKDLFYGNTQESAQRKKLDDKLKEIFKEIHDEVTKGRSASPLQARYQGDDNNNYSKLRKDWWTANRETVWKALTCDAPGDASYFRTTCSDRQGGAQARNKCTCNNGDVPTYFDYVPQTGKVRMDKGCSDCFFACHRYENWIDNQKEQFLKQRGEYENVINGTSSSSSSVGGKRQTRRTRSISSDDNGYESKFYKKLKERGYSEVKNFFEKLNKEKECQNFDDKGGEFDFNEHVDKDKEYKGTFYHSKYCEVCPGCGVKRDGNDWKEKSGGRCTRKKRYKILDDNNFNGIDVLSFGDKRNEIKQKIDTFCGGSNEEKEKLKEQWKCYEAQYVKEDKKEDEEDEDEVEEEDDLKDAGRLLNDSMYWRGIVGGCLKNGKKTCGKQKCKGECDCFQTRIEKKKTEWEDIKTHFKTQDLRGESITTLKYILRLDELFENIKSGEEKREKEDAAAGVPRSQNTSTIDKLLQHEEEDANKCKECPKPEDKSAARILEPSAPGTTLEDENENNFSEESKEELENEEDTTEDTDADGWSSSPEEEIDNKLDVCETVKNALKIENLKEACSLKYGPKAPSSWKCVTPTTNNDDKGSEGGQDESVVAKRRLKRSAGGKRDATAGSICVPPRRRRLYVTPLTKLTGDNTAASQVDGTTGQSQNGEAASNGPTDPVESLQAQVDEAKGGVQGTEGRVKPNGQTAEGSQSHPVSSAKALEPVGISSQTSEGKTTSKSSGKDPREALRDAFIQSAAVGTFFLWHNYKEQFKAQHGAVEALGGFGTYGVRADGPGLVPFSGPQPTLPQAPFAASQGKVGPAGLGPGAGLPRGQHGQPHGTQLGAP
ncbi:hypothetical protein PFDG_00202 [Plasmodium falciparum Dd2]|uniref:Erythrocyte membrane protein 1 n=1 Tax=Plasmodium falciparum (isolate Dd2) TaxID=57267 RepID=A0A0L7LWJ7_PLAF4|nr:hypothetical protein PFDG_00202 [Plasmodium falciparum Dd2]